MPGLCREPHSGASGEIDVIPVYGAKTIRCIVQWRTYASNSGFSNPEIYDNHGYSDRKNLSVSEILSDWSLVDLLLFGGVFTALAGAAAIFLAERWFQKMRQRREHFKIWQDRQLKIWQEQQRESFLRLGRSQQGFDDKNEDNSQKNRPLLLHERVNDFRRKGIGDRTAADALRGIERKSRQSDSRLSGFNGQIHLKAKFDGRWRIKKASLDQDILRKEKGANQQC
jgi:hypothetical protein